MHNNYQSKYITRLPVGCLKLIKSAFQAIMTINDPIHAGKEPETLHAHLESIFRTNLA